MFSRILSIVRVAGVSAAGVLLLASAASAQTLPFERLPIERLAVTAPSERVTGEPGAMRISARACTSADDAQLRRRIVDIATQEWAYFGFNIVDETARSEGGGRGFPPRFAWVDRTESMRVAASIAGYWAVTADGSWILERQNGIWRGAEGVGARWRDPWSAAFISWVMCESGLSEPERFRRHIAHHAYIDQAIIARGDPASPAAYVARDVGEMALAPGDMVCRARRAVYRTIAERQRHLGDGVRSHCDIVMRVEPEHGRILAIGGNVRGKVSLKLLPATFTERGGETIPTSIGSGGRAIFAHLELRGPGIDGDALTSTPTWLALAENETVLAAVERSLQGGSPAAVPHGPPVLPPLPATPVPGDSRLTLSGALAAP